MSTQKRIDWNEVAERAGRMTDAQIHGALIDIRKTLPAARSLDRALGTDDEGYYMDEASIFRAEQLRRPGFNAGRRRVEDSPPAPEVVPRATIDCIRPGCKGSATVLRPASGMRDTVWMCGECGVKFERADRGPRARECFPAG